MSEITQINNENGKATRIIQTNSHRSEAGAEGSMFLILEYSFQLVVIIIYECESVTVGFIGIVENGVLQKPTDGLNMETHKLSSARLK